MVVASGRQINGAGKLAGEKVARGEGGEPTLFRSAVRKGRPIMEYVNAAAADD
jgi:hypothetical protein